MRSKFVEHPVKPFAINLWAQVLIRTNPRKLGLRNFKKSATYKQEIHYLLQCQGSPHVVQLLGRMEEGALIFPKFKRSFMETLVSNKDKGRITMDAQSH